MPGNQFHIFVTKLGKGVNRLIQPPGIADRRIEELNRRNAEILTDGKELRHGWQCLSGGNIVDIAPAMPKIIAHFILRNALLNPKLSNPISNKRCVHNILSLL